MGAERSEAGVVAARLEGGLGNILFQYAAAFALARRRGARLCVHVADLSLHGSHLEGLGIAAETLEPRRIKRLDRFRLSDRLPKPGAGPEIWEAREPHFHYWDALDGAAPDLPRDLLLGGYFQSERYFLDAADALTHALRLDRLASEAPGASVVGAGDGVAAVHVRRGDYARNPKNLTIHGLAERDHYDRARAVLDAVAAPQRYAVFSDDPAAAAALLEGWDRTDYLPMGAQFQDFALMTRCSHWILANSTFSWWGAWLGRRARPNGVVVAPRNWFTPQTQRSLNVTDLYPPGWILV